MHRHLIAAILVLCEFPGAISPAAAEDEFERDPIVYSRASPDNCISTLQDRLGSGEFELIHAGRQGYLRSVLEALDVPVDSQVLVFSKTSLQRHRIAPRTPRAIYFNDEVYVGFCQAGDVLEISAVDPQLGAVFYTLDQEPSPQPKFVRQTDNCLLCHGGSQTHQMPGHLARSVYADQNGQPLLASGSVRVDHTTPIESRWGGWYVTGRHGRQQHLGNLVIRGREAPRPLDNAQGQNVTDLSDRFRVDEYLSPHSDIVALMVLEHQAMAHNLLTRLNFATRQALYYEAALNRETKQPKGTRWESTNRRIQSPADDLVECLLFSREAPLTAPITGTSGFADRFAKAGPHDVQGRSLRQLDLTRRMFRYPCSYLIYSQAFAQLPDEARRYVLRRIAEILKAQEPPSEFAHLSAEDRTAIREILRETLPEFEQAEQQDALPGKVQ